MLNLFSKRASESSSSETTQGPIFGDREGFSILASQFELPTDSASLDRESKRALTICNLFINHQLGVSQIAQLLEDDLSKVIQALVQKKIIRDRRKKPSMRPSDVERRKHN
jgi:hypothetical protein